MLKIDTQWMFFSRLFAPFRAFRVPKSFRAFRVPKFFRLPNYFIRPSHAPHPLPRRL